jgi:hypothetical protein
MHNAGDGHWAITCQENPRKGPSVDAYPLRSFTRTGCHPPSGRLFDRNMQCHDVSPYYARIDPRLDATLNETKRDAFTSPAQSTLHIGLVAS